MANELVSNNLLKEIEQLTQINDHGTAYFTIAAALNFDDLAEEFDKINRERIRIGYLPIGLYEKRCSLYKELLSSAKKKCRTEQCAKLYSVL